MCHVDEAIDESYGVAVVFHEEEEEEGGGAERRKDSTVAYDDDDVQADDDDEGMEADYHGVLKTAVSPPVPPPPRPLQCGLVFS